MRKSIISRVYIRVILWSGIFFIVLFFSSLKVSASLPIPDKEYFNLSNAIIVGEIKDVEEEKCTEKYFLVRRGTECTRVYKLQVNEIIKGPVFEREILIEVLSTPTITAGMFSAPDQFYGTFELGEEVGMSLGEKNNGIYQVDVLSSRKLDRMRAISSPLRIFLNKLYIFPYNIIVFVGAIFILTLLFGFRKRFRSRQ